MNMNFQRPRGLETAARRGVASRRGAVQLQPHRPVHGSASEARFVPQADHFEIGPSGSPGIDTDASERAALRTFRDTFHLPIS